MNIIPNLLRKNPGSIFLMANIILSLFSFSFIPLFLKEQGYSLWQLVFLYVLFTSLASLFIMLVRSFHIRAFLFLGFILHGVAVLLFVFYSSLTFYL